ncbi:MAG: TraR/DksA family transcriptional regulator [Akkermansiaceae bacterium]|jgi:DnaK suppressor protein
MTEEKIHEFKTRLQTERKMITDKIYDQEDEERVYLDYDLDDEYQVDGQVLEILKKLTEREKKFIDKIDLALGRIKNGSYGICTICKADIPLDRLEAKPSVSLCRNCQAKHESNA